MAQKLTLIHARKILGKLAENVSDEEISMEIKVAELLKTLYFNNSMSNNKSKNGKT